MKKFLHGSLAAFGLLAVAMGLSGCGGGNDTLPPKVSISKVYVMGDSLADVGTFSGLKFTIMGADTLVWPQIVAGRYGLNAASQCNFFSIAQTTTTNSGCTNFAIGGARIINKVGDLSAVPTIETQMQAHVGNFEHTDLVLIDGGGNDAADLAGAFLALAQAAPQSLEQLNALNALNSLLSQLSLSTDGTDVAAKGAAYMQALADRVTTQIN